MYAYVHMEWKESETVGSVSQEIDLNRENISYVIVISWIIIQSSLTFCVRATKVETVPIYVLRKHIATGHSRGYLSGRESSLYFGVSILFLNQNIYFYLLKFLSNFCQLEKMYYNRNHFMQGENVPYFLGRFGKYYCKIRLKKDDLSYLFYIFL